MHRIILCLGWLGLAGCVESPVPLESGDKVSDPALIGIWKSDLAGDPMVATIRQQANGALVADVQAYWEPGPTAATKRFEIVLAEFGERRYMSVRNPGLAPVYSLARYVFEGQNRFCLLSASSESLVRDLEERKLPGELKEDRHMSHVALNASPEQLRNYFASEGANAFHEQFIMAFERASSDVLPPPRTQQERDRDPPGFNEVRPCKP